jgi:hypothetical protein
MPEQEEQRVSPSTPCLRLGSPLTPEENAMRMIDNVIRTGAGVKQ